MSANKFKNYQIYLLDCRQTEDLFFKLTNTKYSKETDIEDISDDCIGQFVLDNGLNSFENLYLEHWNKNIHKEKRRNIALYKLITFAYSCVMKFPENKFEIRTVITNNFLNDIFNLMFGDLVIHHSNVTEEIIVYAHNFSN